MLKSTSVKKGYVRNLKRLQNLAWGPFAKLILSPQFKDEAD